MQQPLAELLLQAPDLLADGGLGDPQPLCCAGEVGLVDDRDEVRQLPQFHKETLSRRARTCLGHMTHGPARLFSVPAPHSLLRLPVEVQMSPNDTSASSRGRPRASRAGDGTVPGLPGWPPRTVAVLSTADEDVHAIPVSAPVRAGDRAILLSLHRSRDTLGRIRRWPHVALTFLAEGNVAFTARGQATIVEESMAADPEYAAVSIAVDYVDDHRQPTF